MNRLRPTTALLPPSFTLKLAFRRGRPEPFFDTPLPDSYSFPSGHALLSFCFYGAIAAAVTARIEWAGGRVLVWASAALLVALAGLSRLYSGVHYPSDVLAGYAAALAWVVSVALADRVLQSRHRRRGKSAPGSTEVSDAGGKRV